MKCFKCKQGELEVVEENGKKYARCNNCGITLTANDLRTIISQSQANRQASEKKKGNGLKIGLIIGGIFLVLFVLVGAIAIMGISNPQSENQEAVAKTKASKKDNAKVDEKEVHDYLKSLFDSPDNPSHWLDVDPLDEKWLQDCRDYENECTQKTADKFGITAKEASDIYTNYEANLIFNTNTK